MLERRVEEASLNSWPANQQLLFDGWILRSTGGYTKRANSVTPLYPAKIDADEKIAFCEQFYALQQQPTIFRLPSFIEECSVLDHALSLRGYTYADETHVLVIPHLSPHMSRDSDVSQVSLHEWLSLFCQFRRVSIEKHQMHRHILEAIETRASFSVLLAGGVPVACGLGVLEHNLFGLFDLITHPERRNQGYGTRLITAMLNWSVRNGATSAYLQVTHENQAARRLYDRLGFHELYHYWYRMQSLCMTNLRVLSR